MFGGGLGEAGGEVVIEEFLDGEEASFFALCDGETALPLTTAQDHKRAYDGDKGPNTGGMGAYSPAPNIDEAMAARVMREIITPTLKAMKAMGCPYKGVLYAGLMITAEGPKLIEYNARFGDPETQVLMLRLKSDLVPALLASRDGMLKDVRSALVRRAGADRGDGRQGLSRRLSSAAASSKGSTPRATSKASRFSMPAPRPMAARSSPMAAACSMSPPSGETVREAQARAYEAVSRIRWPDGFCRHDIGWRAVEREKERAEKLTPDLAARIRPSSASEAKQSSSPRKPDCFVASLLAMTNVMF